MFCSRYLKSFGHDHQGVNKEMKSQRKFREKNFFNNPLIALEIQKVSKLF